MLIPFTGTGIQTRSESLSFHFSKGDNLEEFFTFQNRGCSLRKNPGTKWSKDMILKVPQPTIQNGIHKLYCLYLDRNILLWKCVLSFLIKIKWPVKGQTAIHVYMYLERSFVFSKMIHCRIKTVSFCWKPHQHILFCSRIMSVSSSYIYTSMYFPLKVMARSLDYSWFSSHSANEF